MTTTVAIRNKSDIILGTDTRATMGRMIASKNAKKVHKIDDHIGMTIAGAVGDAQQLIKILQAESRLYKISRDHPISVRGLANLLSNILAGRRFFPYEVQLILGGYDEEPHIFSLDLYGGLEEHPDYVATGSGSPFALGTLESQYKPDMETSEITSLVKTALQTAMERDSGSGNNMNIVLINKYGYQEVV